MRRLLFVAVSVVTVGVMISSCQEDFIEEIEDRPTDMIEFTGITASRDSACMFDTILLTAHARGENLKYKWQHAKGSMSSVKGSPDKVYFWGCQTCLGDLAVSCTVENEHGAYTKDVSVFIYPWYTWQEPWPKDIFDLWVAYNKKQDK